MSGPPRHEELETLLKADLKNDEASRTALIDEVMRRVVLPALGVGVWLQGLFFFFFFFFFFFCLFVCVTLPFASLLFSVGTHHPLTSSRDFMYRYPRDFLPM
jgi:hypothetical protein